MTLSVQQSADWTHRSHAGALPTAPVRVLGIKFRDDQIRLISTATRKQRGVLVSPTGSGKTIIGMGFLSQFPKAKVLFVTHSTKIALQTLNEFELKGFAGVRGCWAGGRLQGHIAITTRQSLCEGQRDSDDPKKKLPARVKDVHRAWVRDADIIVVDECHMWGAEDGQYTAIMRTSLAPIRIGLTATYPEKANIAMTLEGALGPKIEEVTYEEARDLNILANVSLQLLPVPYNAFIAEKKKYGDLVVDGIVQNRARNALILYKAKQLIDEGRTVLIFVERLDHGDILREQAIRLFGINAVLIEGITDTNVRRLTKQGLLDKTQSCVISSKVWREGVNIPNLGAVILAGGGKAKQSVMQAVGRGLRSAEGKDKAIIVDMLDPYPHLAEHTIQRLDVYSKMGWL